MKMLFAAVGLAALVPVAAAAQDGQRVERVIIAGADGQSIEVPTEGLTREAWSAGQDAGRDAMFARLDANGDGRITRDEMRAMADGPANWTSDDGRVRVVRREGGSGRALEGSTVEITRDGGDRQIIIRRTGDGAPLVIDGDAPGGHREIFVFRTEGEGGLDANGDGRLSFEEMAAPLRRRFNEMDDNGDGYLSEAERESHRFPAPPAPPAPPRPPVR